MTACSCLKNPMGNRPTCNFSLGDRSRNMVNIFTLVPSFGKRLSLCVEPWSAHVVAMFSVWAMEESRCPFNQM